MDVGINLPWVNYGWDFGVGPYQARSRSWRQDLPSVLDQFVAIGISTVRWFILGDGLTLGEGSSAPEQRDGLWHMSQCPSLSRTFIDDWVEALELFQSKELRIIPVLFDFKLGYGGIVPSGQNQFQDRNWVKQGRIDLYRERLRADVCRLIIGPLLEAADPYRQIIHAIETVNEPEHVTDDAGVNITDTRPDLVDLNEMIATLRHWSRFIHEHRFHSTTGFVREGTLLNWTAGRFPQTPPQEAQPTNRGGQFATMETPAWRRRQIIMRTHLRNRGRFSRASLGELYIPQFHYYPESAPRSFPQNSAENTILGEFATRIIRGGWPDIGEDQSIDARLLHAQSSGIGLAFPWAFPEFNGDGHTEENWTETRDQISAFLERE